MMKVTITISTAGEFPPREVAKFNLEAAPEARHRFVNSWDFGQSLAVLIQSIRGVKHV